jgi:stage II sporulation protein D
MRHPRLPVVVPVRARVSFKVAALTLLSVVAGACAWTAGPAGPRSGQVAPPRFPLQPPAIQALDGSLSGISVEPLRIRLTDRRGTRVVALPLDEYVAGCVRAELPPDTPDALSMADIMSLQAIVSRTYALANRGRHAAEGFDLCDGTHCQLYRALPADARPDLASRSTEATRGQLITYAGKPILALFHSSCGGHTADAESVWGGQPLPYLRQVDDAFCVNAPGVRWDFSAPADRLRDVLNTEARTAVGTRLDRIEVSDRDPAGRAVIVVAGGERSPMVRAEEFRAVLQRAFGPRSLKSTCFTVERRDGQFVFSGVGYGHGVGMCQAGAALRVRAGQSAAAIIAHYFPGTLLRPAADQRGNPSAPSPVTGR